MLIIFSHRRSGTNFLNVTIGDNFNIQRKTSHELPTYKSIQKLSDNNDHIYILRDGRDVLAANYHYFKVAGEKSLSPIVFKKYNITFSKFLRGNTPLEELVDHHGIPNYLKDPVRHWVAHTAWMEHIYFIKFEDLKHNGIETIKNIANVFNYTFKSETPKVVKKLVGPVPRTGNIGTWRESFTDDDLNYFWDIAGNTMIKCGYQWENR